MAIGDQYFDKVVLLCPFDADGIVDKSPSLKSITVAGNAAVSTAQSKFGGSSAYFDGAGDSAEVSGSDLAFETGDFTVEFWIRFAVAASCVILDGRPVGAESTCLTIWSNGANKNFALYVNGAARITGTTVFTTGIWYHVAVCRRNGSTRLFVDGAQEGGTWADTTTYTDSRFVIGADRAKGDNFLNGYIDDLRITKGVARYTSNFSAPTAPNPNYYAQLQGTVKDSNGNFTRRLVRAHRRSDGNIVDEKLSDPSTGAFTLNTVDASKHYAVVHDSDAWITYLPFNGDNNSTLFYEWGGKAVTPFGNAKISTAQSKFGGASGYFDGAGDYLAIPKSGDLALGISDFTIESWIRLDSLGVQRAIFDSRGAVGDRGLFFGVTSSNQLFAYGNGGTIVAGTATALTATTWHHVALVKSSGVMTLYLNGVAVGSAASTYSIICAETLLIGRTFGQTNADFIGFMDDLRISKGVARYVANFTPPTAPHFTVQEGDPLWNNVVLGCHFDGQPDNGDPHRNFVVLNMRGNTFSDDTGKEVTVSGNANISTTTKKYGAGSMYFDGSGDRLTIPHSDYLSFGAGDFSIECWIRPAAFGEQKNLINKQATLASATGYLLALSPTGAPAFYCGDSSNGWDVSIVSATALTLDTWFHLAVSRSGNTFTLYVDGISKGTATSSLTIHDNANSLFIGTNTDGATSSFHGYMDDVRLTKGSARYTANFAPPTAELPVVQKAWIDVSSNKTITPNGNAQISTTQSKFGAASAYFDGTGDYLSIPNSGDLNLGADDFTIDFWIRPNATSDQVIFDARGTASDYANSYLVGLIGGKFSFRCSNLASEAPNSTWTVILNGTTNAVSGTWYHVAVARYGSTFVLFVNGVQEASASSMVTIGTGAATIYLGTGAIGIGTLGYFLNGYIDDLRFTKGAARWTAGFTPPSVAFPEVLQTFGQQNALIYDHLTPV